MLGDGSEFLIKHLPLADVLAFVNARDDVRAIDALEPAPEYDGPPTERAIEAAERLTCR